LIVLFAAVRLVFRRQAHHGAPKPAVIHILKGFVPCFLVRATGRRTMVRPTCGGEGEKVHSQKSMMNLLI
jgi:hypothetical protein